jgi:hypothetical protein
MYELNVAFTILVALFILLAAILVSFFVGGQRNEQCRLNEQGKTPARGLEWK